MTAQATDLTTLATCKQWVGVTTQQDDATLARLVSSVSRRIVQYLGHALLPQTLTRIADGQGWMNYVLPDFPVISLSSVLVDTVLIPPAADVTQAGWLLRTLSPDNEASLSELSLIDYYFTRGKQNVSLTYRAGFQTAELFTPQGSTLTYNTLRPWRQDGGVSYTGGLALTAIASGTPSAGQYLPPTMTGAAETYTYTFASADAGRSMTLTYGYTPEPVEQACLEMVKRKYLQKDRTGQKTMNLAGQNVTYDLDEMDDSIKGSLQPYRKVIPA